MGQPDPSLVAKHAGAAPPTITMSATPSGTGHEEFTLTITFSESVLGFREDDIELSTGTLDDFSGSGASYSATIEPPAGFEGTIHVSIEKGAAISLQDEDNAAASYSFYADNVTPELDDAFVDADELVLVYDDDLDDSVVPGTSDFTVRVEGSTTSIARVDVHRDEVTLFLDSPVSYRDEVTVSYRSGTSPLSDDVGNAVADLVREPVRNTTSEDAGAPGPPRALSATADGSSVIELDWTAPVDSGSARVDGYRIEMSSDAGANWDVLVRDTRSAATSYRHTRLTANVTRHYRVMAINDFGISEPSNTASATTTGRLPTAPTRLTATPVGSSRINLSWRAASGGSGGAVTGYRIETSGSAVSGWRALVNDTRSTGTAHSDTGLAPGTTRYYRVAAINRAGTGAWSNVVAATTQTSVPGMPGNLRATAAGRNQINLSWTAPTTTGGLSIGGYVVETSSNGGLNWRVLTTSLSAGSTSYSHTGLTPGTTHHYRVAAVNSRGRGPYSGVAQASTASGLPGRPGNLRFASVQATSLSLAWNTPLTNGGSAITGYRIDVSGDGGSSWRLLVTTTSVTTTYTHTGLRPATNYHYRVAAVNQSGAGPFSAPAGATTSPDIPGPPRSLMAEAIGHSQIDLAWDRPTSDGGARITGYRIEVSEDRRRTWSVLDDVRGANATTYSHTGLPPRATRHYRVSAINRAGIGIRSTVVFATTDADLAEPPTGLEAEAVGTSRIDLSWTAPDYTGGVLIIGYRVEVSEDAGRSWSDLVSRTRSAATNFAHTGLPAGSTRHYRVSTVNQIGTGEPSEVASATTESTAPGAPAGLLATADGTARIDLSWTEPVIDGGASVTGYRIEVSEDGGFNWADLAANTNSTNTVYAHTGLEPATTRHYRVSAINSVGVGEPSSVASATTDATVPDAPTNLVATAAEATQIDLTWTAPAYDGGDAISGYRIEASLDGVAWADLVADTRSAATSHSHTGLQAGSTRFYRVSAINSAGTGMPSNVATASTDDPVGRAGRASESILPHAAAAITTSTVSAISTRVEAVATGDADRAQAAIGGFSSLAGSLRPGAGLDAVGPRTGMGAAGMLLDGASFVLPGRSREANQAADMMATLATWGGGEYVSLGVPDATDLEWNGDLLNLHVGADVRVRPDVLAGVAATTSSGSFDFTDKTGENPVAGSYSSRLTTVNPYAAWLPNDPGTVAWATGGYGWGEIEIEDDLAELRSAGTSMFSGAAGGSRTLLTSAVGGVRVRGEAWLSQFMVGEAEEIDSLTLSMQRVRLLVEWSQRYRSAGGDEIALIVEGGMRYDGGSGAQGAGFEIGSGMRFVNAGLGMRLEGRGRVLVAGVEGYQEWGAGAILQIDPSIKGQGLSVRVAPGWGETAGGPQELWERGVSELRGNAEIPRGRVDAEVAYGLRGFSGTPYGGMLLADGGARAYSSGLRYELGQGMGLRVEATRREAQFGPARHTLGLRGRLRF